MKEQPGLEELKKQFMLNESWTLTFGAAFQRASVYRGEVKDDQKENFKTDVRSFVESKLQTQYKNEGLDDNTHIKNIYSLSDYTTKFSSILNGGKLNFGVSQKLLNLNLKYLWCLGEIETPPHFPVDRRIQVTLKLKPVAWTSFENEIEYLKIINHVRKNLNGFKDVANYELNHFERRVKTIKK